MTARAGTEAIAAAAAAVRSRIGKRSPRFAVVLGSGLGGLAEQVRDPIHIPYADIPGFPLPTVEGHGGQLVIGEFGGQDVLMQSGRFHMYEGHSAQLAALPVRVFAELGAKTLILTNAAGAVRRSYRAGTLMIISDHLNLTGTNPLVGPVLSHEERFPDMSEAYDPALRLLVRDVARERGISIEEGVYAGLLGPNYETGAEVRMFERWGADAVGMSTVIEVIAARARGLRCLGISTITNAAAGTTAATLSHAEVMEVADRVKGDLGAIVSEVVKRA